MTTTVDDEGVGDYRSGRGCCPDAFRRVVGWPYNRAVQGSLSAGQLTRRTERSSRGRGSLLWLSFVALSLAILVACVGDDEPGGQPADPAAADTGPLALHDGSLNGQEAALTGELVITDECVFVADPNRDDLILVVWPAENVSWNRDSIVFDSPNRGRVILKDGEVVSMGGGGTSESEDGLTFNEWIARIGWVCRTGQRRATRESACGGRQAIS